MGIRGKKAAGIAEALARVGLCRECRTQVIWSLASAVASQSWHLRLSSAIDGIVAGRHGLVTGRITPAVPRKSPPRIFDEHARE
jgi:hypothetical protein